MVGNEYVRDELVYMPVHLFIRKYYAKVVKCPVAVRINEPNRKVKTEFRMWDYCAGKYEPHTNILF